MKHQLLITQSEVDVYEALAVVLRILQSPVQILFFSFLNLNNINLFSFCFGGWNFEIRVPTCSGFGKSSLLGLQTSSCHVLTWQKERELSVASSKDTNLMPAQTLFLP